MNIVTAGVANPLEVTFDSPSLFVGLKVYDTSTGSPVAVGSVINMANVPGSNTYLGFFTPIAAKTYLFLKRVYTDVGLTTLDPNYGTGSESAYCSDFAASDAALVQVQNTLNLLVGRTTSAQYIGLLTGNLFAGGGAIPGVPYAQPAEIIQGARAALLARIVNGQTLDPFDLSDATEITACFLNDDETDLTLSLTGGGINIISGVLGKLQLNFTAAQAAALAATENETLEIAFTFGIGEDPIKVQIPNAYNVLQAFC